MFTSQAAHHTAESFRDLLLRHRGRTGLTQREVAARTGANRRTIQEWEAGATYPSLDRLQSLVEVLLEVAGFTEGREAAEALGHQAREVRSSRWRVPPCARWRLAASDSYFVAGCSMG